MRLPRYRVATVEGWPISGSTPGSTSGNHPPGLSASVLDSVYLFREVATYRSEDRGAWPERGNHRGRAGALAAAQDHAAYLNARERRAAHRDRMAAYRAEARRDG